MRSRLLRLMCSRARQFAGKNLEGRLPPRWCGNLLSRSRVDVRVTGRKEGIDVVVCQQASLLQPESFEHMWVSLNSVLRNKFTEPRGLPSQAWETNAEDAKREEL